MMARIRSLWTALCPHLLPVAWLLAVVCLTFSPWLRPYHLPERGGPEQSFRPGDLTPLYAVWLKVAEDSLFDWRQFPLWNPYIYAGDPFFAKPQVGVLSIATAMLAVLPAYVAATYSFLLHLVIGGVCLYALLLYLGVSRVSAVCGATVFILGGIMYEQTLLGHAPIVHTACWMPLVLLCFFRGAEGTHPFRNAAWIALLLAVQLLAGGESIFLYTSLLLVLAGLCWVAADRFSLRALGRVAAILSVAFTLGAGLSAVKVLPARELIPVSNRAGGLLRDEAAAAIPEFREPGVGPLTLALSAAGLVAGLTQCRFRRVTGFLLVSLVIGVAVAKSPAVFGLLWDYLPFFKFQRIPQRALILAYLSAAAFAGFAAELLVDFSRPAAASRWMGRVTSVLLPLFVLIDLRAVAAPLPPTADIRQEIAANSLLNYVAEQPGLFRFHTFESFDRNWGIEHVTVPLGIQNLMGWDSLWLAEYLGAEGIENRRLVPFIRESYRDPARLWGLMNVKLLSSQRPLEEYARLQPGLRIDGFHLLEKFPECTICQPAKSAGPYLYENDRWLPRARWVPSAVLVLGPKATALPVVYRLLHDRALDLHRYAVLHEESLDLPALRRALQSGSAGRFPAVILLAQRRPDKELLKPYAASGGHVFPASGDALTEADWSALDQLLPGSTTRPRSSSLDGSASAVSILDYTPSRARYQLSQPGGFLLLSEKYAHFPGWRAVTPTGRRPLLKANAVTTAVLLEPDDREVVLRYWPQGFAVGWLASGAALLVWVAVLVLADRIPAPWQCRERPAV